ncbi:hypothetical protein [Brevundimonas sp. SL130]|uniref:hypothetical protein n=1 Tax=Brevundimonas sp. SL130 TaxID=2995143 RepID=UPI00226C8DE7|nr:hypothetical protein [Brevundimonas sp. SL130]WAC60953.1 hypothetical protein OU998_05815 [Brevundimonas sp. SL130]
MTQIDGPEERAATLLNGGMVVILSGLLAAAAVWGASDYLWRAITQGAGFWQIEIFVRFLIPLGLVGAALRGVRFGLKMMRSESSQSDPSQGNA